MCHSINYNYATQTGGGVEVLPFLKESRNYKLQICHSINYNYAILRTHNVVLILYYKTIIEMET
jgi:hypothetical protein